MSILSRHNSLKISDQIDQKINEHHDAMSDASLYRMDS